MAPKLDSGRPFSRRASLFAVVLAALVAFPGEGRKEPVRSGPRESEPGDAPASGPVRSVAVAEFPSNSGRIAGRVVGPDGRGVAGAWVHVDRESADVPSVFEARADADGFFEFRGLPGGRWVVRAGAPGFAQATAIWDLPAQDAELTLTLAPVARIAGYVMAVDGTPGAGAELVLVGSGVWPPRTLRAGADGRFLFDSVPPGVYEVRARLGSQIAEPRRGLELLAGSNAFLTFHLERGAALTGVAVDAETLSPLAGAEIVVLEEELGAAPRTARTSADGRFRIEGLLPFTHRVTAYAEGYVPIIARPCHPGEPLRLEIERGAVIEGVVLDDRGRPIEGARIEVIGEGGDRQPFLLDGTSRALRAATFRAHEAADHSGVPALEQSWLGTLGVTSEVPPIPSEPFESRTVSALAASSTQRPPETLPPGDPRRAPEWVSGIDGSFQIRGVPPGSVQVIARAEGFMPGSTERIHLGPGSERRDVTIVLSPAGRIEGTVLDAEGEPVARVVIEYRSDHEPEPRFVFSDERGRFVIEHASGAVTLRARSSQALPAQVRLEVEAGETVFPSLVLPRPGPTLVGRVIDEHRRPIPLAAVRLESMAPGDASARVVVTDADGHFEIEQTPPTPWRIVAKSAPDAESEALEFDEPPRRPIELVLREGAEIAGRVVDRFDGEPVAGAEVTLERARGAPRLHTTRSDAEGAFRLVRVAPGPWWLRINASGYAPWERTIDVTSRGVELDSLELERALTLEGDVVDALGRLVRGADITIDGLEGGPNARTDARGHFVLQGVPPGIWRVRGAHPAAGEVTRDVVVRAAREPAPIVLHLPRRWNSAASAHEDRTFVHGVAVEVEQDGDGVRIGRIPPGSLARRAGLREGDTLRSVDGAPVESAEEAAQRLRGADGVEAVLEVVRDGERFRLRVPRQAW